MNIRYVIISACDIDKINFSKVLQTAPSSLRRSLDGQQVLVKYDGDQPEFIYAITQDTVGLPEYNHQEILVLLNTREWSNQD